MKPRLLFALLPRRCAFCGRPTPADTPVCGACQSVLPRIEGVRCPKCGRGAEHCVCRSAAHYYDGLAAPYYYEGVVRRGLHRFKFRRASENAALYAQAMAEAACACYAGQTFDLIVPVPMTEAAKRERGYDQARLLADALSDALGIPCAPALVKCYETFKQHGLNAWMRKGNLAGVFDVPDRAAISGRRVLLVDDVSTSGETLNECAKMLWLCGASSVHCIAFALTKYQRKND